MRRVVVDANVFVSFFIDRNAAQHAAARAVIQSAEDGDILAIVPQAVVFEVAYVVLSQYSVTGDRLATVVKAVTSFPGTQLVDECPWKHVLEILARRPHQPRRRRHRRRGHAEPLRRRGDLRPQARE